MNPTIGVISWILVTALAALGQSPPNRGDGHKKAPAAQGYTSESPLPEGWTEPGPYDQVVRRKYPAYRAAFTPDSGSNGSFMRLFRHIKGKNIPMTSPVAMDLDEEDKSGMKTENMAFLYQSPEVGETGADGETVEVKDMPAVEVLAYAWHGSRNKAATALARKSINAALAEQNLKASGYRLFSYNSPFMARSKQTHELQAILE